MAVTLLSSTLITKTRASVRRILQDMRAGGGRLRTGHRVIATRGLRTGLSGGLPSPAIACSRLCKGGRKVKFANRLITSRSFSFPSLCVRQGGLSGRGNRGCSQRNRRIHRRVLLRTGRTYLSLVFLGRRGGLLSVHQGDTRRLTTLCRRHLRRNSTGVLRAGGVRLRLLGIHGRMHVGRTTHIGGRQRLRVLGKKVTVRLASATCRIIRLPLSFTSLHRRVLRGSQHLLSLRDTGTMSSERVDIGGAVKLPSFRLNCHVGPSSNNRHFGNFLINVDVPLFSGHGGIGRTGTRGLCASLRLRDAVATMRGRLLRLCGRSMTLGASVSRCNRILRDRGGLTLLGGTVRTKRVSVVRCFMSIAALCRDVRGRVRLRGRCRGIVTRLCGFGL